MPLSNLTSSLVGHMVVVGVVKSKSGLSLEEGKPFWPLDGGYLGQVVLPLGEALWKQGAFFDGGKHLKRWDWHSAEQPEKLQAPPL